MRVTVFGLGEAGSLIAGDLVRAGAEVHGYDPASVTTPEGVTRHRAPTTAVAGADLILAVTAARDATTALTQAITEIDEGTVFADVSTASPGLKQGLSGEAASHRILFADVALMAPVPGNGLHTPALASGPGAAAYAGMVNGLGGRVEVIEGGAGEAAARKLLRSVITKGLTSLVIESLQAARLSGNGDWLWAHLVDFVTEADVGLLQRLIAGTPPHVDRRIDEMETARDFLEALGVPPTMTSATVELLRRVKTDGGTRVVEVGQGLDSDHSGLIMDLGEERPTPG